MTAKPRERVVDLKGRNYLIWILFASMINKFFGTLRPTLVELHE